jgi:NADPH:quinone reductase-like Zn-dependent oxidoreductase
MTTMKAARIHRFGGAELIRIEEIPIPRPEPGEVLVRVAAASLNPVDYKIREGSVPMIKQEQLPLTLGRDLAGTLESLGDGVSGGMLPGQRVFAMIGADGGYAEYARVKAEYLAEIPPGLDMETAASVPLAGHTAWQALFDHGQLQPGQRVLIHGGSGGVGHFAVQFAKAKGAEVFASGSKNSVEFIRSLGADRVIDYTSERFEDICSDIDLVIDLIGGETQQRSWAVLRPGGTLVSTLGEPQRDRPQAEGKRAIAFMAQPNGEQLKEIAALIAAGKVRPALQKTFPLAQAAEAQRYLEQGHVRGKVVLSMAAGA